MRFNSEEFNNFIKTDARIFYYINIIDYYYVEIILLFNEINRELRINNLELND